MQGQVIQVLAGFYDIVSNDVTYRVRGSGKLRKTGVPPLVGDFVEFDEGKFVNKVIDRENFMDRPKVANVDQVVIVTSLVEPDFSSILLHKFLAIVESKFIKPIIVFTKSDLTEISYLKEYEDQGYEVYEISNNNPSTLKEMSTVFKDKLSVFTGQTGAGKTSTINSLANTDFETQEISKALGRGKHTTRVVKIIPWLGGRLIDTPGFSSLEFSLTKQELAKSFADFREYSKKCKFPRTCQHNLEEDCEVKRMIGTKFLSKQRYTDYLRLLGEAEQWRK